MSNGRADMAAMTAGVVQVLCPACDSQIPVTVSCRIDGRSGDQTMVCTPDMIDLWAHMFTHGIPAGTLSQSDHD